MLSPDQRLARAHRIGSSDAAAIVNLDPYRTPFDVWARLTGRLPADDSENSATMLGTYLEAGLLDYVEARVAKRPLARHVALEHPDGLRSCNLDGLVHAGPLVEAKVSGLLARPEHFDEWGMDGTDEVPTHVLLQVHHQFAVANAQPDLAGVDEAIVVALLQFRGFVVYRVRRNDQLVDALAEREVAFLRDHVDTNTPPLELPRMETLKRLIRQTDLSPVPVADDLVRTWQEATGWRKAAETIEEQAKRAVIAALGDAEAGACGLGAVTYTEQTRPGFTTEDVTFRVLRLKQPKEPKPRRRAA